MTRDMVSFIRNTYPGLAPRYFEELVLGKKTTKDFKKFENLVVENLQSS